MAGIDRCNVLFKRKISRTKLIDWAEKKGADFNNDDSIEAINYFIDDYKNDLIEHFNNLMTFKVESIIIEEIDSVFVNVIFKIEESYPSFHKPEEKKILLLLVNGAVLHKVNYIGFEIDFLRL